MAAAIDADPHLSVSDPDPRIATTNADTVPDGEYGFLINTPVAVPFNPQ